MTEKIRTSTQNKCLHRLFADISLNLLEQGIERRTIINDLEGYSCPVDATFVKEVWRAIQFTQTGKQSTTQLTTAEVDRVYETFNRFLGEEYGIHCEWPSVEAMSLAYLDNEQYQ